MNNIYYVFQPIIDVKTNEIFGYEALMRAKDVSIVEIINNCETYEDFYTLERETFFKACKEYKKRGYDKHIF